MIAFLLHLAGPVALLIWSVRLIRTGVERAFMPQLRAALRMAEASRPLAALSGTAAATMLQSSTAVALLLAGVIGSGGLGAGAAVAVLLGADLGSAIAAQILLLRLDWLEPLLLLGGTALYLHGRRETARQTGRILVGLGLVFLSLDLIRAATAPLAGSDVATVVAAHLQSDLLSAFAIGAVFAFALQSSLAAVLTVATFAAAGLISLPAGMALVLGANLGGAVVPLTLTLGAAAPARRAVVANLMLRGTMALFAVAALIAAGDRGPSPFALEPERQIAGLHFAFNLVVALVGLPLAGVAARLGARVLPERTGPPTLRPPPALDPGALDRPDRALACANREILRMAERVATMLGPALRLYTEWDERVAASVGRAEDEVDRMHFETKLYLAELLQVPLDARQARRAMDLGAVANNLEDAGDQISTHMIEMARRMQVERLVFSPEGARDLAHFHDAVMANARLALDVLVSGSPDVARQLLEEKDRIRVLERDLQERHLGRLRDGSQGTVESSNIHQETLRALKAINTALCFAAYPIAEAAGVLKATRLSGGSGADRLEPRRDGATSGARA